jgi:hypothetical protein
VETALADLKVLIYKAGAREPDSKVIVPLKAASVVVRLLPGKVADALAKEGVDLSKIAAASGTDGPIGTLLEIKSPEERVVILVE